MKAIFKLAQEKARATKRGTVRAIDRLRKKEGDDFQDIFVTVLTEGISREDRVSNHGRLVGPEDVLKEEVMGEERGAHYLLGKEEEKVVRKREEVQHEQMRQEQSYFKEIFYGNK